MATRISETTLNASTIDILNVIRANASLEYQQLVPEVASAKDIPKVGEVIYGHPALSNQFINALVNRIALVVTKSATFNNPYARLKKGYLEFGESVEEIFVNIATVRTFDVEKAPERELKRTLPDVRSAFHIMNWRVQYPVTIQDQDLMQAFTSMTGVQDLIAKIVDSVYKAAQYDEFLLFKYLLIKAVSAGKMYPLSVGDGTKMTDAAKVFRGSSNKLEFMSTKYNASGVATNTPKSRQIIFMDSEYNAAYDVDVLASAFNMGKAEFMGSLYLIDDFTTFDNERFKAIRQNSDMVEEVTTDELNLMKNVKAILVDEDWFQIYDNNNKFTEDYIASGMYWNYFYNVWKTVSSSPFANAIVFVTGDAPAPATLKVNIADKSVAENATVFSVIVDGESPAVTGGNVHFVQTEEATKQGVAVQKYGAIMFPPSAKPIALQVECNGATYTNASEKLGTTANVGTTITLTKV